MPEKVFLACLGLRKDEPKIKELFNDIEKLREEFESIERPNLELETPTPKAESPSSKKLQSGPSQPLKVDIPGADEVETDKHAAKTEHVKDSGANKVGIDKRPKSSAVKTEQALDAEAELAKLESEFGKVGRDYSTEEVGDWEFDELERELRSGD